MLFFQIFRKIRIFTLLFLFSARFVCVFDDKGGDGDVYSSACFVSFEVTDHNALKLADTYETISLALVYKSI